MGGGVYLRQSNSEIFKIQTPGNGIPELKALEWLYLKNGLNVEEQYLIDTLGPRNILTDVKFIIKYVEAP